MQLLKCGFWHLRHILKVPQSRWSQHGTHITHALAGQESVMHMHMEAMIPMLIAYLHLFTCFI